MGNNDSRTLFRDHIQQLANEDIPEDSLDFWHSFFTLDASIEDIYTMVAEADIFRLLVDFRKNFYNLIDFAITNLEESHNQVLNLDTEQLIITSNSVKILSRVLMTSYKSEENEELWWEKPRLYRTIKNCLGLLHTPVYSVYASLNIIKRESIVLALIWREGILSEVPMVEASEAMWQRRYELLLLLKSCMFEAKNELKPTKAVKLIISEPWIEQTVVSIINTLITFNPYGFMNLPYASYAQSKSKESALKTGLQIICILSFCEPNFDGFEMYQSGNAPRTNRIKSMIKNIKDRRDLILISKAVRDVMNAVFISNNTYLPASQRPCKIEEEVLFLLFLMIKENSGFIHVVLSQNNCLDILQPILSILIKTRSKFISLLGLYILIKLSENRRFSVLLNSKLENCNIDLPLFTGTYADLLINAFTKLIFSKDLEYELNHNLVLTIINNFSYYLKSLSTITSHNLIKLLQEYSLKAWIDEVDTQQENLALVLEIINNLIQYQWRASKNLVFWIIQNQSLIYKLQKNYLEHISSLCNICFILVENLKEMRGLNENQFVDAISKTTLVGILPVPHQIMTRKINFQDSKIFQNAIQYFFQSNSQF